MTGSPAAPGIETHHQEHHGLSGVITRGLCANWGALGQSGSLLVTRTLSEAPKAQLGSTCVSINYLDPDNQGAESDAVACEPKPAV